MRIRTIKPEFWTHPVMGRLDDSAKLMSIGLLNYADDEGYFYADPSLIRAAIRPFDDCSTIVRRSIEQLTKTGFVSLVEHPTHGMIGKIVSFSEHQKIDRAKESKIKDLYESSMARRRIDDDSLLEQGSGNRDQGKDTPLPPEGGSSESDNEKSYPSIVEELWKLAPPKARNRSSKLKVEKAWKATRAKPFEETVIASYREWSMCHDWTKDGGQFAPGVHVWIKDRKWESPPNNVGQSGKPTYRQDEYPEEEHVIRDLLPNPPTNTSR